MCIYIIHTGALDSCMHAFPESNDGLTPSSHSKNSLSKICSKGWVAQKPFSDG